MREKNLLGGRGVDMKWEGDKKWWGVQSNKKALYTCMKFSINLINKLLYEIECLKCFLPFNAYATWK